MSAYKIVCSGLEHISTPGLQAEVIPRSRNMKCVKILQKTMETCAIQNPT